MLTYYQPFLLPFLQIKRYDFPKNLCRKFFISFEDALWDLLQSKKIPQNSIIFIPDFYCMDVVDNIRNHGYTPMLYPLDDHFQISKKKFDHMRREYKPAIIILFHACGIQNKLIKNVSYIQKIAQNSLIIEDAVQRLVNPQDIHLHHVNHVIIDSLRKTSPLHGSFIYGSEQVIQSLYKQKTRPEFSYQFLTFMQFILFKLVFSFAVFFKSSALVRYAHVHILKKHDDLIGDNTYGHKGPWYVPIIHRHISFSSVELLKRKQFIRYETQLKKVRRIRSLYRIRFDEGDSRLLHVFPVGFTLTTTCTHESINSYFKRLNIPIWTKFPDCPWSKTRAVLFLPLGFHVEYNEIDRVCKLLSTINYL